MCRKDIVFQSEEKTWPAYPTLPYPSTLTHLFLEMKFWHKKFKPVFVKLNLFFIGLANPDFSRTVWSWRSLWRNPRLFFRRMNLLIGIFCIIWFVIHPLRKNFGRNQNAAIYSTSCEKTSRLEERGIQKWTGLKLIFFQPKPLIFCGLFWWDKENGESQNQSGWFLITFFVTGGKVEREGCQIPCEKAQEKW